MLCNTCRRSILIRIRSNQIRDITNVSATPKAASSNASTPAVSSATPGISQPLSTPFFPSTSTGELKSLDASKEKKLPLQGSIPGGAELKGLAYLKAKPSILAKEDDEYPGWLWTLLDEGKQADGKAIVDLSALTKKQRAKYERKQARLMKDVPKPIPIHEQSKDLTEPGESADISLQRRLQIVKSSRAARRKGIREDNFLRSM